MAKIVGTFENFWLPLEAKAKAVGVKDGDLTAVRASVKNLLVTAGWSDSAGNTSFLSASDQASCLAAAEAEVSRVAPTVAASRKLVVSSGFHPTKASVSAGISPPMTLTEMSSVPTVSASNFRPEMGKAGDRCPRCSATMEPVGLVNDRAALYCAKDRVVTPLPSGTSLRH